MAELRDERKIRVELAVVFRTAEAHGDHDHAGLIGRPGGGLRQVRFGGAAGLDEHDVRPRRDRVDPLDVLRFLHLPGGPVVRSGRVGAGNRSAGLADLAERRPAGDVELRQAELSAEIVQVVHRRRVVVRVDDGHGLPAAVAGGRPE